MTICGSRCANSWKARATRSNRPPTLFWRRSILSYEKLHLELAPLVGSAGVQALFARSATLTLADFPGIGGRAALESSTKLREALRTLPPSVTEATAAALFAAFLALITTFIGERLTTEVLRRAWPKIEERATKEMKR